MIETAFYVYIVCEHADTIYHLFADMTSTKYLETLQVGN